MPQNKTLDRETRGAVSRGFQWPRPWRTSCSVAADLIEASWKARPGDVAAGRDSATKVDVIASVGRRFYRVLALP